MFMFQEIKKYTWTENTSLSQNTFVFRSGNFNQSNNDINLLIIKNSLLIF